jgi:hypothetical protein
MKTSIYVIFATLIIGFSIYSCEKEQTKDKQIDFKGQLISKSACKSNLKSTKETTDTPDSLSCVDYSFDNSTNILTIKHINAGYNCCPDSFYCIISLNNDTIIIKEIELNPKCNCNCLYDLNIGIQGIDAKKYQIKFIEPYVNDQKKILFGIDLANEIVGSYCVTRKQYPWGLNSLNN